ncbi:toll/interleukin-1 receptor domain-containing protein [Streptomyces sp. NPDC097610]|uniref:toll/interleukin-1 receptor domain-containing protein n=1 Tax=Streptomyces sp. NPDC097610 TaxID=3157227 RepID=UPI003330188F
MRLLRRVGPAADPGKHVFLCSSRQDREDVQRLKEQLADKGFNAWIDLTDILPSAKWREAADGRGRTGAAHRAADPPADGPVPRRAGGCPGRGSGSPGASPVPGRGRTGRARRPDRQLYEAIASAVMRAQRPASSTPPRMCGCRRPCP